MQRDSSLSQKMTKQKGMRLSLEVIFATLTDQSTVRYFIINKEITGWEYDPDKIVLELLESPECDIPLISRNNCLVHSTIWRFEPHQTVVLSYFVYSDLPMFRKNSGKLISLLDTPIRGCSDHFKPGRNIIDEKYIVSNGIKQISHLVKKGGKQIINILTPESIHNFQSVDVLLAGRLCLVGRTVAS
jgi:hypothetical protein